MTDYNSKKAGKKTTFNSVEALFFSCESEPLVGSLIRRVILHLSFDVDLEFFFA